MFKNCVSFVEAWLGKLCKNLGFYTKHLVRFLSLVQNQVFTQVFPVVLPVLFPSSKPVFQSVPVGFYTFPTGPSTMKTTNK